MVDLAYQQGYFSVVRWRPNPTRDEARNVAVMLFDAEGTMGGLRKADLGRVSHGLREQGILDTILVGLQQRLAIEPRPDLAEIRRMHMSLGLSLYVTDPKPCAVVDVSSALNTLERAYIWRAGGGGGVSKARLVNVVVRRLRRADLSVAREATVRNFTFDLVVTHERGRVAMEVLTFAKPRQNDWRDAEHDAGHFLFGLERADLPGLAVVQPPSEASTEAAEASFGRVRGWCSDAKVPVLTPAELADRPENVLEFATGGNPIW